MDDDKRNQVIDPPKLESKPQATFLTKLYALLERPEYQSMIRWDSTGEQIIVERPEQLALHVLPSIYRQSRFASFSRQLNIYGFMRKVNLRNVDPAIDDPDASTWSHPTLNRHSPPEVVANFKRRVPPRLPKPRKRSDASDLPTLDLPPTQQHSTSMAIPSVPSLGGMNDPMLGPKGAPRTRGYSLPQTYTGQLHPLSMPGGPIASPASATYPPPKPWGSSGTTSSGYARNALPPLSMDSPFSSGYSSSHSSHPSLINPITPSDDHSPHSSHFNPPFSSSGGIPQLRDSSVFTYGGYSNGPESSPSAQGPSSSWNTSYLPPLGGQNSPGGMPHSSSGSTPTINSILNPSGSSHYSTGRPSFSSSFSGMPPSSNPHHGGHGHPSPEPRSNSTYSMGQYDGMTDANGNHDGSRPLTPLSLSHGRPSSSKSNQGGGSFSGNGASSLSIRNQRPRRRSDALSGPYPTPYYDSPNPSSAIPPGPSGPGNGSTSSTTSPRSNESTGGLKGGSSSSVNGVPGFVDPFSNHHFGGNPPQPPPPPPGANSTPDLAYSPVGSTASSMTAHQPQQHLGLDSSAIAASATVGLSPPAWNQDPSSARHVRPSTSTSSLSGASIIHTPPQMTDGEEVSRSIRGHSAESTAASTAAGGDLYSNDFFNMDTGISATDRRSPMNMMMGPYGKTSNLDTSMALKKAFELDLVDQSPLSVD